MGPPSMEAARAARTAFRRRPGGRIGVRRWYGADGLALLAAVVAPLVYLVLVVLAAALLIAVLPESTDPTGSR